MSRAMYLWCAPSDQNRQLYHCRSNNGTVRSSSHHSGMSGNRHFRTITSMMSKGARVCKRRYDGYISKHRSTWHKKAIQFRPKMQSHTLFQKSHQCQPTSVRTPCKDDIGRCRRQSRRRDGKNPCPHHFSGDPPPHGRQSLCRSHTHHRSGDGMHRADSDTSERGPQDCDPPCGLRTEPIRRNELGDMANHAGGRTTRNGYAGGRK